MCIENDDGYELTKYNEEYLYYVCRKCGWHKYHFSDDYIVIATLIHLENGRQFTMVYKANQNDIKKKKILQ